MTVALEMLDAASVVATEQNGRVVIAAIEGLNRLELSHRMSDAIRHLMGLGCGGKKCLYPTHRVEFQRAHSTYSELLGVLRRNSHLNWYDTRRLSEVKRYAMQAERDAAHDIVEKFWPCEECIVAFNPTGRRPRRKKVTLTTNNFNVDGDILPDKAMAKDREAWAARYPQLAEALTSADLKKL